jgi:hypothetical protein
MTFGLKNAGATYQRAIFHDLLWIVFEIYIDDVMIKSDSMNNHLANLCLALERMRRYGLKINPLKCAFGVSASKFLGFIIHEHGIEIDPTKIESINKVQPPQCKNDMQTFLGKLNYLRWFIFNLSGKISGFAPILRLKNEVEFTWGQISNTLLMTSKSTCLHCRWWKHLWPRSCFGYTSLPKMPWLGLFWQK